MFTGVMQSAAGQIVEQDVAMTTRDGTRLVADVYRPDDDSTHPVLLHRTAYGKRTAPMIAALIADPAALAAHGYAVVVQDVRGRFGSEGEWTPFVHERDDGYDAVEWAAAQPWSNGRVGVYGSSYMGITAYQAVLADPPHLQAAATVVSGCDVNDGLVRTGGVLELGFMSLWALSTATDTLARTPDAGQRERLSALSTAALADPWAAIRSLPVSTGAPAEVSGWLAQWLVREPTDPWWQAMRLSGPDVGVPLLQIVGFRDWMQRSMIRLFRELPEDDRFALIAGPWTHRCAYGGDAGLRDWSGAAPGGPVGHTPALLAWFDRWLTDTPTAPSQRVRWFATGTESWSDAPTWPPAGHDATFHLAPGGILSSAPPQQGGWDGWRHDPADPVPTCGGMIAMPLFGPDGVQDRSAVEQRDDVLVYTGPVLREPLPIAGDVRVHLTVGVDAADADIVAMLVDVTPDGVAEPVTEGVQRLRYRGGTASGWTEPGVPIEVTVFLADTAHTVLPGHRLRLEIAASNFPRWSLNAGTREIPEQAGVGGAFDLRVAHGSRLVVRTRRTDSPS